MRAASVPDASVRVRASRSIAVAPLAAGYDSSRSAARRVASVMMATNHAFPTALMSMRLSHLQTISSLGSCELPQSSMTAGSLATVRLSEGTITYGACHCDSNVRRNRELSYKPSAVTLLSSRVDLRPSCEYISDARRKREHMAANPNTFPQLLAALTEVLYDDDKSSRYDSHTILRRWH